MNRLWRFLRNEDGGLGLGLWLRLGGQEAGGGGGTPPSTGALTLEDGVSYLTLEDGTSKLTLEG